jgi:hypothetical protein
MPDKKLFDCYEKQKGTIPKQFCNLVSSVLYNAVMAVDLLGTKKQDGDFLDTITIYDKNGDLCNIHTSGKDKDSTQMSLFNSMLIPQYTSEIGDAQKCNSLREKRIIWKELNDEYSLKEIFAALHLFPDIVQEESENDLKQFLLFTYRAYARRYMSILLDTQKENLSILDKKLQGDGEAEAEEISEAVPETVKDAFPLIPQPFMDRSIAETELMADSTVPHKLWYQLHQLLYADEMITQVNTPLPDFTGITSNTKTQKGESEGKSDNQAKDMELKTLQTQMNESLIMKRRHMRYIPGHVFSQILSTENMKEPTILKKYYELSDQLIYMLTWPAPDRRAGLDIWCPDDESISTERQYTINLNPAGPAVVLVKQYSSTGSAWVSIHLDDNVFGLRHVDDLANKDRKPKADDLESNPLYKPKKPIRDESVEGEGENESVAASVPAPASIQGDEVEGEEGQEGAEGGEIEGGDDQSDKEEVDGEDTPVDGDENSSAEKGGEGSLDGDAGEEEASLQSEKKEESIVLEDDKPKERPIYDEGPPTNFVCEFGKNNARLCITTGPTLKPNTKPDRYGTMCANLTDPGGVSVVTCSNGSIKMSFSSDIYYKDASTDGIETSRFFHTATTEPAFVRNLTDCVYSKDICFFDGSRILVRGDHKEKALKDSFHDVLIKSAPFADWVYILLKIDGSIVFFSEKGKSGNSNNAVFHNIHDADIDDETSSTVRTYMDGRLIVENNDKCNEVRFPDGTRILNANNMVVYIEKAGLPSLEVDLEIETMCDGHARGKQIALNKGGLRVRSRIALCDGSALLLKYDTRITAKYNGSIKFVAVDRSVIIASDDGKVQYFPRAGWNRAAEEEFIKECEDTYAGEVILEKRMSPETNSMLLMEDGFGAGGMSMTEQKNMVMNSVSFAHDESFNGGMGPGSQYRKQGSPNGNNNGILKSIASDKDKDKQEGSNVQGGSIVTTADENTEPQTSYIFNLKTSSCCIEDFEYNRFDFVLTDPLHPFVDLAGEVAGLKPLAITDKPLDPRLFIISRDGFTREIVSDDFIKDHDKLSRDSPDFLAKTQKRASEMVQRAEYSPSNELSQTSKQVGEPSISEFSGEELACDFQSGNVHLQYYYRRRQNIGNDFYEFTQVFAPRNFHNKKFPALAQIHMSVPQNHNRTQLKLQSHVADNKRALIVPRVYQMMMVEKFPVIRPELFLSVKRDYENWLVFKKERELSLNQYEVTDPRSETEKADELMITNKLIKMYKNIEKAKAKAAAQAAASPRHEDAETPVAIQLSSQELMASSSIVQSSNNDSVQTESVDTLDRVDGLASIHTDDGESTIADKMERNEKLEKAKMAHNLQIMDAFDDYAVYNKDKAEMCLDYSGIRGALLTLLNKFIDDHIINAGLRSLKYQGVIELSLVDIPEGEEYGEYGTDEIKMNDSMEYIESSVEKFDYSPVLMTLKQLHVLVSTVKEILSNPMPAIPENGIMNGHGVLASSMSLASFEPDHTGKHGLNDNSHIASEGSDGRARTGPPRLEKPSRASDTSSSVELLNLGMASQDNGFAKENSIAEPSNWSEALGGEDSMMSINKSGSVDNLQKSKDGSQGVSSGSSLDRLSKTAPGKAQNENQHWFPESESIMNSSTMEYQGGHERDNELPVGAAHRVAKAKAQK